MKLLVPETKIREYKTTTGATISISGVKVTNANEGIVEAIVNVSGNRDSDGDVVLPGASAWGLGVVNPKGVRSHDWSQPVARTLSGKELMPGDTSLPQKVLDAGLGGLWVQGQYNMKSDAGREAFESVQFFGEEQQWSVGYEVGEYFMGGKGRNADDAVKFALDLNDDARYHKAVKDALDGANPSRFIVKWITYEWSDVLFGANDFAMTMTTKDGAPTLEQMVRAVIEREYAGKITTLPEGSATEYDAKLRDLEESVAHFGNEAATKAGRVQAGRNLERLETIFTTLSDMLTEAGSTLIAGEAADDKDLPLDEDLVADADLVKHRATLKRGRKIWADPEGSFEDLRSEIRDAASDLFNPNDADDIWTSVEATFPSYALIGVYVADEDEVYFRVPWVLDPATDSVALGKPEPIDVEIVITPLDPTQGDADDASDIAAILAGTASRSGTSSKAQGGLSPSALVEFAMLAQELDADVSIP